MKDPQPPGFMTIKAAFAQYWRAWDDPNLPQDQRAKRYNEHLESMRQALASGELGALAFFPSGDPQQPRWEGREIPASLWEVDGFPELLLLNEDVPPVPHPAGWDAYVDRAVFMKRVRFRNWMQQNSPSEINPDWRVGGLSFCFDRSRGHFPLFEAAAFYVRRGQDGEMVEDFDATTVDPLFQVLACGEATADGINRNGEREQIPAGVWATASVMPDYRKRQNSVGLDRDSSVLIMHNEEEPRWIGIRVESSGLLRLSATTSLARRREFRSTLLAAVKAAPNRREGTKRDWQDRAKNEFRLPRDTFSKVWREVLGEVPGNTWLRPGRPSSSCKKPSGKSSG